MKVLFVSSGNSHYGIIPFIKSQGESLIKEGIDVTFFTVIGKGISGYLSNLKKLRKIIKNEDIDLIHAHYGLMGLLSIFSLSGKPIVLSIMGSDAYGDFDIQGRRKTSSYLIMFLTQLALLFSKQIIVKSKNILNIIPYKRKSQIIPNGVNFDLFKPSEEIYNKNQVLFLANPKDPRKNFTLVKNAIKNLTDLKVELLNPFPVKQNQFASLLNDSAVFILASYNEGSPNVIKEAMACNIPIVSTDVGDVREVIKNTQGCYLSEFDEKDMSNKIRKALMYGKRTTGRNDIKHLESSIIAKKVIEVYDKAIN